MTDAITRPLAALMAALHNERSAFEWQPPGCAAALHRARHLAPVDQLAHAAIDLATRADLRTPALLAEDGPWWHTGRTPDVRLEPARCTVPGHEHELAHNCRACIGDRMAAMAPDGDAALTISPEQHARNEAGAAAVRAKYTRPAWMNTTERTAP